MEPRVYRDTPINQSTKKGKKTKVLPEMRKIWNDIRHTKDTMDNMYFKYRYVLVRIASEEDRQRAIAGFIKTVAQLYQKKDVDIDYIMHSQQYLFGKVLATEECEDGEPIKKFDFKYYMDYFDLGSAANLQGYLALRTRLRRYEYVETEAYSLLRLYIFELLNLIGVENEHEALKRLIWLNKYYGLRKANETEDKKPGWQESEWERDSFSRDLKKWIKEFGWYYGCDNEITNDIESSHAYGNTEWQVSRAEKVEQLKNIKQLSDGELAVVLLEFAGGDVNRSIFRKEYKSDFDAMVAKIYREMDARAQKRYEKSWIEKHTKREIGYKNRLDFFSGIEFLYEEHENKAIGRNLIEAPHYNVYFPKKKGGSRENTYEEAYVYVLYPTDQLHSILKYLDYVLRRRTKFRAQVKKPELTQNDMKLVDGMVRDYFEQKRKAQIKARLEAIKISQQEIDSIRSDAEVTRDSLLVEDELQDIIEEVRIAQPDKIVEQIVSEEKDLELTAEKTELIKKLLNGEKCAMSSLEVDQINEKFYDQIGDNILEFDNNEVTLYNDYIDDVRKLLG